MNQEPKCTVSGVRVDSGSETAVVGTVVLKQMLGQPRRNANATTISASPLWLVNRDTGLEFSQVSRILHVYFSRGSKNLVENCRATTAVASGFD